MFATCSVLFLPVQMCSRVSEALLLHGLCLSLSSLVTLTQTVRLNFYVSLRSQAPHATAVQHAFLFFNAKAWPQSLTDLFTCTTVLHCGPGRTFLWCINLLHFVACTTVLHLSESLVEDSHKRLTGLSSTEKPQYCVLQVTWSHIIVTYVLWRGTCKHCTWRKCLT